MARSKVMNWVLALAGLVALAVVLTAALKMYQYGSYSSKARSSEILSRLGPAKLQIAERAIDLDTLAGAGVGVIVQPLDREAVGEVALAVSTDGEITVDVKPDGPVFRLTPSMEGGDIRWTCVGVTGGSLPLGCREAGESM